METARQVRRAAPDRGARLATGLLLVAWALVAARFAYVIAGRGVDDFFITYRYALNLASGDGFVFNPGERVFGTTAPGMALLLALAHLLTRLPIELLGTLSTALSLVTIAALLLLDQPARRGTMALGGTLLVTSNYLWLHNGAELPVTLALLALAARWVERRPALAGALAGLAAWCRPDAVVAMGLLGVMAWWRARQNAPARSPPTERPGQLTAGPTRPPQPADERLRRPRWLHGLQWLPGLPLAYGLTAAAVLAVGLAAATAWFGRPLPGTLDAKRLHSLWRPDVWRAGADFWNEGVSLLATLYFGAPAAGGWLLAGGIGLWLLARSPRVGTSPSHDRKRGGATAPLVDPRRPQPQPAAGGLRSRSDRQASRSDAGGLALPLLLAYAVALTVLYPLLGVPFYTWYAVPSLLALMYGVAATLVALTRAADRFLGGGVPGALLATAVLAVAANGLLAHPAVESSRQLRWGGMAPRYDLYRDAGEWLREHSAAGESVTYVEVGTIGYYSGRRVRDLLGLVTPEVLPYLAQGDVVGAFLAEPTELFLHDDLIGFLLDPIRDAPWFAAAYVEVARFERLDQETLVVYRRRPGAVLPTPSGVSSAEARPPG